MVNREDIGSWLEGPPRESRGAYPGERLGLPENGPGSIAPMWRRVVALFIDGIMSQLIAMGLLGYVQGEGGLGVFKPLLVVFEDLHWIDEISESMLADFTRVVPQTSSMVVVTYRPEYRGRLAGLAGAQLGLKA